MTSATNAPAPATSATLNRPNMVSIGTMVWLASELMFFAGLFAMYFSLRAALPQEWAEEAAKLNVPYALANTIILVSSSVTAQFGVWRAEEMQPRRRGGIFSFGKWGMIEWFYLTFVLGAIFVGVQAFEFATLVNHEELSISTNAYGSVFYLTTGFHGLHVVGGLLAFLLIIGRAYLAKRFGQFEATAAIVVSYYWHFVDVVWIALFSVIYFLK